MKGLESPASMAGMLVELFPAFAVELEDEELSSYHQVLRLLTPRLAHYLQASSVRRTKQFCELVDAMVAAGGERENAMSTCLLEHASQIGVSRIIRPLLSGAAKQELR
jgi:hypothetical protein